MPSLTRAEATARAALIAVGAVDVDLDLDRGAELFGSRTTLRFTSRTSGASTFVELRPRALHSVTLNGRRLDPYPRRGAYDRWSAYDDSKLANRHFAQGLDRRFRSAGPSGLAPAALRR